MMAKMTMANKTNNPIWRSGAIALMIDFKTTCRPGVASWLATHYAAFYVDRPKVEKEAFAHACSCGLVVQ